MPARKLLYYESRKPVEGHDRDCKYSNTHTQILKGHKQFPFSSLGYIDRNIYCNGTSKQCTTTAIKYYLELPFHQSITPKSQSNPFTGISKASTTTSTLQYVITLINHCKSHTNTRTPNVELIPQEFRPGDSGYHPFR